MTQPTKKQHWTRNSALISLLIHIALFVSLGSMVVVNVARKEKPQFEGRKRSRPPMELKTLKIPVKVKNMQKKVKPKLHKRITVKQTMLKRTSPTFSMPDVRLGGADIGGILGSGGGGLGEGAGSLGFSLSNLDFMGVKSKGEKVVFLMNTDAYRMASDEKGGLLVYDIVKRDVLYNIGNLSPATLFNVVLYDSKQVLTFKSNMVAAVASNKEEAGKWLEPINKSANNIGIKRPNYEAVVKYEPITNPKWDKFYYLIGLQAALEMKPDVVFILDSEYPGAIDYNDWTEEEIAEWEIEAALTQEEQELARKNQIRAQQILNRENAERKKKGLPARVAWLETVARENGFTIPIPKALPTTGAYSLNDIKKHIYRMVRDLYGSDRNKHPSINFVMLTGEDEDIRNDALEHIKRISFINRGKYRVLKGLPQLDLVMNGKLSVDEYMKRWKERSR